MSKIWECWKFIVFLKPQQGMFSWSPCPVLSHSYLKTGPKMTSAIYATKITISDSWFSILSETYNSSWSNNNKKRQKCDRKKLDILGFFKQVADSQSQFAFDEMGHRGWPWTCFVNGSIIARCSKSLSYRVCIPISIQILWQFQFKIKRWRF